MQGSDSIPKHLRNKETITTSLMITFSVPKFSHLQIKNNKKKSLDSVSVYVGPGSNLLEERIKFLSIAGQ